MGNPFLLMEIEKHMDNEVECWRDYIRRCMLTKTFHIPGDTRPSEQVIEELLKSIFPLSSKAVVTQKADTLLQSLNEKIQAVSGYRDYTVRVEENTSDVRWAVVRNDASMIQEEEPSSKVSKAEKVVCALEVRTQRQAYGYPMNSNDPPIHINGYMLRKGAFNGDIVEVEIFGRNHETGSSYGRVIGVPEPRHPEKFVCRADLHNAINFLPIDKTLPPFLNLPFISQKMLQHHGKDVILESQRQYITVFVEDSLAVVEGIKSVPKIRDLIPLELASGLLFIVKLIGWAPRFRKPLGAVIEVVPRSTNLFFTERLLKIAHNINDSEVNVKIIPPKAPSRQDGIHVYERAFTIDPPNAINLDDAISLVPVNSTKGIYKLSVLITDVAKHINKDMEKVAEEKMVSVYGAEDNCIHMLPYEFCQGLSLLPHELRDVIAISAEVTLANQLCDIKIEVDSQPKKAQMVSQLRLCYESAQRILNNETLEDKDTAEAINKFDSTGPISIHNTLHYLLGIAKSLRIKRLGEAGHVYSTSDPGEEFCWQSHLLVSELMIWANAQLADYMVRNLPNGGALLRCQLPPSAKEIEDLNTKFKDKMVHSLELKSLCSAKPLPKPRPLLAAVQTIEQIQHFIAKGDKVGLLWALSDHSLYPELAAIDQVQIRFNRPAEYICKRQSLPNGIISDINTYSHYGLRLPLYTHFTSPIRRYCDIKIQKIITALIKGKNVPFSDEEMKRLCMQLNSHAKLAKRYEKATQGIKLVRECESNLQRAQAFMVPSLDKEGKYELCFSSSKYKYVKGENTRFDVSQLNCCIPGQWHVVSASLGTPNYLLDTPTIGRYEPSPVRKPRGLKDKSVWVKLFHPEHQVKDTATVNKNIAYLSASIVSELVEIPSDVWALAHKCIKAPSDENISHFASKLPPVASKTSQNIGNREQWKFAGSPVIIYDVKESISSGNVTNVWLGRSLGDPVPTPSVHLMEVAPTIQICMAHNQNPAMCFSDVQLKMASKKKYSSLEEYISLWTKVLLAEASHDGVQGVKTLLMIREAHLEYGALVQPETSIDNLHYVPKGQVTLEIPVDKREISNFIEFREGDLMCARYPETSQSPSAIYHFVIDRVDEEKNEDKFSKKKPVFVRLIALGDNSCKISHKMKKAIDRCATDTSAHLLCDLQLIRMPDSFR